MDKTETKIVYSYDSDGKLIRPIVLDFTDRSPSGIWQLPSGTTEITPELKEGYDLYFKDGAWQYVEYVKAEEIKTEQAALTDRQKLANIRMKRDSLLSVCDYTQLNDAALTNMQKATWQTYRQSLRDMPEKGCSDLDNPIWPIPPES